MSGGRKTRRERVRKGRLRPLRCAVCGRTLVGKVRMAYGCLVHAACVSKETKE